VPNIMSLGVCFF